MRKIYLMPTLKERMLEGLIFQQDGAPCQFHNDVTSYLNAEKPVRIGRGGVSIGPARSPNLTPLDFSIWTRNLPSFTEARDKLSNKTATVVCEISHLT
ncbi:hypothetical protein AVEN_17731-1 [Araneus ventricosus]|uniref:Uncharacterized protein n=1 Tax=Araneus ventricosus TaxID=182803 RepID=A0A4Y2FD83_ARAVE|nr:hypothetical protein AVEN_17731-1 [Araneus ventricosus]